MGWRAACIFVNENKNTFLTGNSKPRPELVQNVLNSIGLDDFESRDETTLDSCLYPDDHETWLGSFEGGHIIASQDLSNNLLRGGESKVVRGLSDIAPNGSILAITLHSGVNLFGYAYFENGVQLRARAGSADDGVFIDEGEPLPEEQKLFDLSEMRDGERIFKIEDNGRVGEYTEDQMGEEFVFELCRRALGERFDGSDILELPMYSVRRREKPNLFERLFGRK